MNLSNNFTLEALTFSEYAVRHNIDNTPNADQIINLTDLSNALERVQSLLGFPLNIHSAYRSPKVNAAVGGSPTSAHMEGYAADFTCSSFGTPLEVCQAISSSDIHWDQLIHEYKSWCHLSVDPRMRAMRLTKNTGEPYVEGLA